MSYCTQNQTRIKRLISCRLYACNCVITPTLKSLTVVSQCVFVCTCPNLSMQGSGGWSQSHTGHTQSFHHKLQKQKKTKNAPTRKTPHPIYLETGQRAGAPNHAAGGTATHCSSKHPAPEVRGCCRSLILKE